jgi:hypothetical protein
VIDLAAASVGAHTTHDDADAGQPPTPGVPADSAIVAPALSATDDKTPDDENVNVVWPPTSRTNVHVPSALWFSAAKIRGESGQ